jgi:hypothetical protein
MASLTAALKAWGRHTVVDSSEKAELILEAWDYSTFYVKVYTESDQA